MNARTKLEALHAEMLGDLQEVHTLLQLFRQDFPSLMDGLKKDGDAAAGVVKDSMVDFLAQSMALAEFIKLRKKEVLDDIEQSTIRNAQTTKRALGAFRRGLWALGALAGLNLVLTAVVLVYR